MKRSMSSQQTNNTKKPKYICKFKEEWTKEYSVIRKSSKGDGFAFCTLCSSDCCIMYGGKFDIHRHIDTKNHKARERQRQCNRPLQNFFIANNQDATKVMHAEVMFTNLIAQHNLPFLVADHFTKLVKQMFPDSQIAKRFACGRTKTTQILKGAIAPELDERLTTQLSTSTFGFMCDESNDLNDQKNFVMLVRVYDEEQMKVTTRFLDMPTCNIGTGETLFNAIDASLRSRNIPWKNMLAFNSDNASVMKGKNNSVMSRIRNQQPQVIDVGCICHLANLVTKAAVKTLPIKIDDLLIDIYYHFHYSAKRKEIFKDFCDFTGTDAEKIIKHCTTRWLSLCRGIDKTLKLYDALKSYFVSHKDAEDKGRVRRVRIHLEDPNTKLYLYFLKFALAPLATFNTMFQSDDIQIQFIYPETVRLIKKLMGFFVPIDAIISSQLSDVPYNEIQLPDEEINCGSAARVYLTLQEEEVGDYLNHQFFCHVKKFYCAALDKAFSCFPVNDVILKNIGAILPKRRTTLKRLEFIQIANKLSNIIPADEIDALTDEVTEYQLLDDDELPSGEDIARYWGQIGKLKSGTQVRFKLLPKLVKCLLVVPHSNAPSERAFSVVKKIVTDQRSSLDNTTICSLLSAKFNQDGCCVDFLPSPHLLASAKKVTHIYNSSESST